MKDENNIQFFERMLRQRGIEVQGNDTFEEELWRRFEGEYSVLILDSSGFTRLTRDYGIIHFLALIMNMRDLTMGILRENGVIDFWYEADNLYAIFPDTHSSVQAAFDIQKKICLENSKRKLPSRLEVCIGIGSGKFLYVDKGHIFGQEMNFASKLGEDIAVPGEILLTASAYLSVCEQIVGVEAELRKTEISSVVLDYYAINAIGKVSREAESF